VRSTFRRSNKEEEKKDIATGRIVGEKKKPSWQVPQHRSVKKENHPPSLKMVSTPDRGEKGGGQFLDAKRGRDRRQKKEGCWRPALREQNQGEVPLAVVRNSCTAGRKPRGKPERAQGSRWTLSPSENLLGKSSMPNDEISVVEKEKPRTPQKSAPRQTVLPIFCWWVKEKECPLFRCLERISLLGGKKGGPLRYGQKTLFR